MSISRQRMERVATALGTSMSRAYEAEFYGEPYPDKPGKTLWNFEPGSTCPSPFYENNPPSQTPAWILELMDVPEAEVERAFKVLEIGLGLATRPPDPNMADIYDVQAELLPVLAINIYNLALMAAGTLRGRAIWERMQKPIVGDMVLATTVPDLSLMYRRFGQLEAIEREPQPEEWNTTVDGEWQGGPLYVVRNIHEDRTTTSRWFNVGIVAIPIALNMLGDLTSDRVDTLFLPGSGITNIMKSLRTWTKEPRP